MILPWSVRPEYHLLLASHTWRHSLRFQLGRLGWPRPQHLGILCHGERLHDATPVSWNSPRQPPFEIRSFHRNLGACIVYYSCLKLSKLLFAGSPAVGSDLSPILEPASCLPSIITVGLLSTQRQVHREVMSATRWYCLLHDALTNLNAFLYVPNMTPYIEFLGTLQNGGCWLVKVPCLITSLLVQLIRHRSTTHPIPKLRLLLGGSWDLVATCNLALNGRSSTWPVVETIRLLMSPVTSSY